MLLSIFEEKEFMLRREKERESNIRSQSTPSNGPSPGERARESDRYAGKTQVGHRR